MKRLNAEQLKALDDFTVQNEGVRSLDLMERAASKVTENIVRRWDGDWRVIVFAGPGNNGGDALAVARQLIEKGYEVETFLFNTRGKLNPDCETNRQRLQGIAGVRLTVVESTFEAPKVEERTLIVDGLFGTGLSRSLSGGFSQLVKFINAAPADVVAIDMPSGLMTEDNTGNVRSHIVRANLTVTFQVPKLAQLLADCSEFVGELVVEDIGLSSKYIDELDADFVLTEADDVRSLLKPRNTFGHKGSFGHALLVAGSCGMAGASILAARACLRSGVGKLTLHTPKSNVPIVQVAVPEAVLSIDKDEKRFTEPVHTDVFQAVAIGPGLGTESGTSLAFVEQVRHTDASLLVDADGLNILADHKGYLQRLPAGTILTPHPGELVRLGVSGREASYSVLAEAREIASTNEVFVVLKGHFTAVCCPSGKVFFNPTGNCGMATAGSGDVLSGVILALLARRYNSFDACRLGVYLHGLAGDIAALRVGEESLIASDIVDALPEAFIALKNPPEGGNTEDSTTLYTCKTQ